jgi:uncharacterized protein with FMN-binding domain
MRRAILALVTTVTGLVLLASFKATPMRTPPGQAVAGPAGPASHVRSGGRWVIGSVIQTPFGPVRVKVRLTGHHISDVQALQLPHDLSYSQQLSASAGPLLRREAIQAQSARIDAVSGATYTSEGYRQSLQAALDNNHG